VQNKIIKNIEQLNSSEFIKRWVIGIMCHQVGHIHPQKSLHLHHHQILNNNNNSPMHIALIGADPNFNKEGRNKLQPAMKQQLA
jgi:hypothetical protein